MYAEGNVKESARLFYILHHSCLPWPPSRSTAENNQVEYSSTQHHDRLAFQSCHTQRFMGYKPSHRAGWGRSLTLLYWKGDSYGAMAMTFTGYMCQSADFSAQSMNKPGQCLEFGPKSTLWYTQTQTGVCVTFLILCQTMGNKVTLQECFLFFVFSSKHPYLFTHLQTNTVKDLQPELPGNFKNVIHIEKCNTMTLSSHWSWSFHTSISSTDFKNCPCTQYK